MANKIQQEATSNKGATTSSKKLLGTKGIATRSKKLLATGCPQGSGISVLLGLDIQPPVEGIKLGDQTLLLLFLFHRQGIGIHVMQLIIPCNLPAGSIERTNEACIPWRSKQQGLLDTL